MQTFRDILIFKHCPILNYQKKNYEAKKSSFLNRVNKLQSQYGLADSDTAGDYHQHYWLEYVLSEVRQQITQILQTMFYID